MTFKLDISGHVETPPVHFVRTADAIWRWSDLSPFTQGYIEALMTALVHQVENDEGGAGLDACEYPAFADLAPETLARIIADCEAWRDEYSVHVRVASGHRADMGREFWRIRQEGRRSTFPPLTVQLGDDGLVRFE